MPISLSAILGVAFLALAFLSTFLMFRFWGYPYDKERRKSECPQWKMNIHRVVGIAYVALYVVMMTQMVPRLWEYQIEFPARTVAHIVLGLTIGVLLIIKLSILRWFRHFEEWMPVLGVLILVCTVLLSGLSLPFVFKEQMIASHSETFGDHNRVRVKALLEAAQLPPDTDVEALTSERGLRYGRRVLLEECTFCHDLKTAIDRPRTPEDWLRTVERMAAKPTVGPRISVEESIHVTAYLVAITPALQESAKAKRAEQRDKAEALEAIRELEDQVGGSVEPGVETDPPIADEPASSSADAGAGQDDGAGSDSAEGPVDAGTAEAPPKPRKPRGPDPDVARRTYENICAKCHGLDDVEGAPPTSVAEVGEVIERMVENGMEASKRELRLIRWHMIQTYVRKR